MNRLIAAALGYTARACLLLTIKLDLENVVPVKLASVARLQGLADPGGVGTQRLPHVVQRRGHGVDGVHHKHDLGLGLEGHLPQRVAPARQVVEAALELVLPELPEQRAQTEASIGYGSANAPRRASMRDCYTPNKNAI